MANDFRTILPAAPGTFSIEHSDRLLLIGSCFTENIGAYLQDYKFNTLINPFGIVYNPVSIARCLMRLLNKNQYFTQDELFEHLGLWRSWEHHSRFSGPYADMTLQTINDNYQHAADHLQNSNRLLLTLGTSVVSILNETGQIVANNHKIPTQNFTSQRLSVALVSEVLGGVLEQVKAAIPDIKIVLTVSPVRHLRLGTVENQRSKAVLLLACDEICRALPDCTSYFPAYEWLMDDLRDYRFYAPDMIHPSETATAYIWQQFNDTFFTASVKSLNQRIEKIQAAVRHRPFNPDTPEHTAFKTEQLRRIEMLTAEYPYLDFSAEKKLLAFKEL